MKIGCPNCGSNIIFVPEKQKVYCDHCKTESDISSIKIDKLYNGYDNCNCSSCGSNLIVEDNTYITICPYCGSNQIIKSKFNGQFKPNKIIPFKYGREKFYENFKKHVISNKLVPDDFINHVIFSDIKGIYIPYKMVHVNASANTRGTAIDRQINLNEGSKYIDYYKLFDCDYDFDSNIIFDVSSNLENVNANSVGPFNHEDMVDFNPAYLCDFSVEIGDETREKDLFIEEIINVSNEIVKSKIQEVKPGDKPSHYVQDIKTKEKNTEHIFNGGVISINFNSDNELIFLVPIWFFQYSYKMNKYNCLMNGQTGKIVGTIPLSKIKYAIKTFKIFIIPMIILAAITYFFTRNVTYTILSAVCLLISIIIGTTVLYERDKKIMSNISNKNLNVNYNMNIKDYNEFDSTDKYSSKHKDDMSIQDITVSNAKDINYHDVRDNYYHLIYKKDKEC